MGAQTNAIRSNCPRSIFILFVLSLPCLSFSTGSEMFQPKDSRQVCEDPLKSLPKGKMDDGESILIRLGRIHFDPIQGLPMQRPGFKTLNAYQTGEKGYYIVQFDGPVKRSWKEALTALGVDIFDYIPDFAFIIRMDSANEPVIRALDHVRWLGIYQPSYRGSQSIQDKVEAANTEAVEANTYISLRITVFPGEDMRRVKADIMALDGYIVNETVTKWKITLTVRSPKDRIADLSAILGVKWIEPVPEWRLLNNVSTDTIGVRSPRNNYGLYGEGQTVAVCDSGLDSGSANPASLHDDFEDGSGGSRVMTIYDRVGDGANDVNSGHGTHVAGSVLGNGYMSGSDPTSNTFPSTAFAGIAPKANLVFQAVEANTTGALSGIPSDLNVLFSQADNAGADLHTNSWGGVEAGAYTSSSEDVDEYMWDHPDFLILFSAGNQGADLDADGVIDLYNMDYPATAKNCLTVGASEGNRPTGAGYDGSWADIWPYVFSMTPISNDHISDEPDGMAAFSARGPVLDGRYKPDLVAPGSNILSTRSSDAFGTGWGDYDAYYRWMGGTSMAAPLVAGTAALMREYLIKERNFTNPSAALIKAALLNSAEDISPGQYGTGIYQEIPDSPVPNNVEGWGRVNLENGLFPTAPLDILYYDGQNPLDTGEYYDYIINIIDSSYPFKVNLVWTDYPGSAAAQGGLVNDLDLLVVDPSGTTYYPDNASQKTIVSTLAYDDGFPEYTFSADKVAIRFTPTEYPVNLESTTFYFYNPNQSTSDVDIVVYDDDNGLPGTELFRKTLSYVPSGWITTGIAGVVINSGDFFIAIEKNDDNLSILQDNEDNGRSYYDDGSGWMLDVGYTSYIRAHVRGADYSGDFDRANNAVGLTLDNPIIGTYTVRVSGYNIPQGPQSYALIARGPVTAFGFLQFSTSTYSVREDNGVATVVVTRTGGKTGAVSITYAASDGTAADVTDYTPVSDTLQWDDGDDAAKVFDVAIIDDSKTEGSETINLALSNPQGGASLGYLNTAVITISDNDSRVTGNGSEGDGSCFISTVLSIPPKTLFFLRNENEKETNKKGVRI